MSTATLNRQDFARLVQDRLIQAGEDRPLEYDAAGFLLIPRGTHGRGDAMPLEPFHRMYLAAPQDLEFVVKQFVEYWKGAQKQAGAAVAGPIFVPPVAAAKYGQPPPTVGYAPRPRSSGVGTVLFVLLGGFVLMVFLVFAAPLILILAVLHGHNRPAPPPPVAFGPMPQPNVAPPNFPWPGFPGTLPEGAGVTEVVGGRGGGDQDHFDPAGRPLVGLAYALDEHWDSNGSVLGALQPIFDRNVVAPDWRGQRLTAQIGKEGYVVGGLLVDASKYVNAVKIVFVRQNGDDVDPADTYESDWLGKPRGGEPRKLAGDGQMVLGLHCKQGLVLDAVGLIVRPAPATEPVVAEAPVNPFAAPPAATPP